MKNVLMFAFLMNFVMLFNSYSMDCLEFEKDRMSGSYDDNIVSYSKRESLSLDSPFDGNGIHFSLSDDGISKFELDRASESDDDDDELIFKLEEDIEEENERRDRNRRLINSLKCSFVSSPPFNLDLEKRSDHIKKESARYHNLVHNGKFSGYEMKMDPINGNINCLILRIMKKIEAKEKVVINISSDSLAEEFASILSCNGIRTKFMPHFSSKIDKIKLVEELHKDRLDVLVGVNIFEDDICINGFSVILVSDLC